MRGSIPPLPNTPSWSVAKLKHLDQDKEDEMGEACDIMGEIREAYKIFVTPRLIAREDFIKYKIFAGKPEGKRPLGRHKRRWERNLEWILGKYGGKVWTRRIWLRIRINGGLL
jgi:hypothetical protein